VDQEKQWILTKTDFKHTHTYKPPGICEIEKKILKE
jgi:hypothetical protein